MLDGVSFVQRWGSATSVEGASASLRAGREALLRVRGTAGGVPYLDIEFDHLIMLATGLADGTSLQLGHCTECGAALLIDKFGSRPATCRHGARIRGACRHVRRDDLPDEEAVATHQARVMQLTLEARVTLIDEWRTDLRSLACGEPILWVFVDINHTIDPLMVGIVLVIGQLTAQEQGPVSGSTQYPATGRRC
jgi:hypothetical protein